MKIFLLLTLFITALLSAPLSACCRKSDEACLDTRLNCMTMGSIGTSIITCQKCHEAANHEYNYINSCHSWGQSCENTWIPTYNCYDQSHYVNAITGWASTICCALTSLQIVGSCCLPESCYKKGIKKILCCYPTYKNGEGADMDPYLIVNQNHIDN